MIEMKTITLLENYISDLMLHFSPHEQNYDINGHIYLPGNLSIILSTSPPVILVVSMCMTFVVSLFHLCLS
jgi:hypothetical protein